MTAATALAPAPRPRVLDDGHDLDSVRLDAALAALPGHELAFQHGVDNVVRAVAERAGRGRRAAAAGRPSPRSSAIADGGERMPPKTTFFQPKPRTGLVLPVRSAGPTPWRRPRYVDGPGGAGAQQRREVAGPLLLLGGGELAVDLAAVLGPLDGPEHADRRRLVGPRDRRDSANARPGSARCSSCTRMRVLADVGDVDDPQPGRRASSDHALLAVGAEADRLAVLERDQHVGPRAPCR